MESNTLVISYSNENYEIKKLRDLKIGDYLISGNLAKPNFIKIENITSFNSDVSLKVSQKLGDDIIFSPTQKVMFNLKNNRCPRSDLISQASSEVTSGQASSEVTSGQASSMPYQVSWFSREESQWKTFTFETLEFAKEFAINLKSNDTIIETLPNLGLMNLGEHLQFLKSGEIEFGSLASMGRVAEKPSKLAKPISQEESLQTSLDPYLIGVWCDNTHSYNTKINDYLKRTSRLPCFASTETRKKILAGILDSKGKYLKDYNCFEVIINSDIGLREDALFIARSLGFLGNTHNKYIYISGNFNQLNLQIIREFPVPSASQFSDVTQITVLEDRIRDPTKHFVFLTPKQFIKLSLLNNQPVLLADFTLVIF